ncbi:hypothetical protein C5S32_04015 [ANME-1 cluster archaeon GoMg1]|nr:hypothetical protein [ANME-1 cluster archaeon GoMg1]
MTTFRYVKHGVKRKHGIIEGILPLLEQISEIEGVEKVIPASISHSPSIGIRHPELRFQRETPSGFKLLAHSKRSIQEIFVVVERSKKEEAKYKLLKDLSLFS